MTAPEELALTLEEREREIRLLNASPNGRFLVARVPGAQVVGFLVVNGGGLARTRHVGRLELLVARPWRRRGVGRALLGEAVRWAEENPVLTKLSLSVFADNTPAIALYRSLGFVEEGLRRGEYREADGTLRDDLLLARDVSG